MSSILVASNVLLDVMTEDEAWFEWSAAALEEAAEIARLVINPVIFAEVSVRFSYIEEVDAALPTTMLAREGMPYAAAFLVGKASISYRRRGGAKSSPLPDFFIGAHAAVAGYRLMTRDASRYETYFPKPGFGRAALNCG